MIKYRVLTPTEYSEEYSTVLSVTGARLTELPDGLPHLSIAPRVGNGLEVYTEPEAAFGYPTVDISKLRVKLGTGLSFNAQGAIQIAGGGASVTVSPTPPATPTEGNLWWDTDDGTLRIYYTGEAASQWVDATPVPSTSVSSVFGRTGAVSAQEGDYNLNLLSDVTLNTPLANQLLAFNGTTLKWENTSNITVPGDLNVGGTVYATDFVLTGGATSTIGIALDYLDDVVITSPQPNQILQYVNGTWVNSNFTAGSQLTVFDETTQLTTNATTLRFVGTGVTATTPTPGSGDVTVTITGAVSSVFGRTGVITAQEGDYSLNLLSDVVLASVGSGQFLRHNGAEWANWTLTANDIPNLDAAKITTGVLATARGGTGLGSFTTGGYLYATSSSTLGQRTAAELLTDISATPSSRTLTINGTTNQVTVTGGAQTLASDRTWTISLPQNIHTGATPTFAGLTLTGTLSVSSTATFNGAASFTAGASFTGSNSVTIGTDPGGTERVRVGGDIRVGGVVYATDFILTSGSTTPNQLTLDSLFDVDTVTTPPADGQALVFSTAAGLWRPGTVTSALSIQNNGTAVGSRQTLNFIPGTGVTINAADDSTNGRVNVTLNASPATGVQNNGSTVGTRQFINFIPGSGVTLAATDDGANNRVNVTITASGGAVGTLSGGNITGDYQVTQNIGLRFGASTQVDANDGFISAGRFGTGLNIVGTQTSAGTGRQVRVWGTLLDNNSIEYVRNTGTWGINISGNAATVTSVTAAQLAPAVDYTTPTDPSGYTWIRFAFAASDSFNNGQQQIEFYVTRAITFNNNTPYGGCTAKFTAQAREWYSGQELLSVQYGEIGANASFGQGYYITNARIADQAGSGYWVYLRVRSGITYRFREAQFGGTGCDFSTLQGTTDPGSSQAVYYGINLISSSGAASYYYNGRSVAYVDTANPNGVSKLYRRDATDAYNVQTYWTGTRWRLYGYLGDTAHADTHVGYADAAATADRAFPRRSDGTNVSFIYSGQSGQPSWLWGTNDGTNFYVWNPSNFSVNYATSAGNASTVTNGVYTTGSYANPAWITSLASTKITGTITATSASTLTTSRSIWGQSFNGSADVSGALSNATTGSFSSTVTASNFVLSSDARLKVDLTPVTGALEGLRTVGAYRYTHTRNKQQEIGVLAQEIREILPEAVIEEEDGMLAVAYDRLVPFLLAAVKELAAKVDALEGR